jgi:hypothetical protein
MCEQRYELFFGFGKNDYLCGLVEVFDEGFLTTKK